MNKITFREVEPAEIYLRQVDSLRSRVRELEAENARLKEEVEYNESHYEAALANWNECMKGIDRLKEENKLLEDEYDFIRCYLDRHDPTILDRIDRAFTTSREGNDR